MTPSTPTTDNAPLFTADYRIYINHTDAGGIVYHANHLVFFENCRRDWFTTLGLDGYFLQTDDGEVQHFVVNQIELKYRKAILLDETINVRIDKVELKPASIIFYQSIHRLVQDDSNTASPTSADTLLSHAKVVIACVQNQPKSEEAKNKVPGAPATIDNSTPIRPIRVPKMLKKTIQQAISNSTKV